MYDDERATFQNSALTGLSRVEKGNLLGGGWFVCTYCVVLMLVREWTGNVFVVRLWGSLICELVNLCLDAFRRARMQIIATCARHFFKNSS